MEFKEKPQTRKDSSGGRYWPLHSNDFSTKARERINRFTESKRDSVTTFQLTIRSKIQFAGTMYFCAFWCLLVQILKKIRFKLPWNLLKEKEIRDPFQWIFRFSFFCDILPFLHFLLLFTGPVAELGPVFKTSIQYSCLFIWFSFTSFIKVNIKMTFYIYAVFYIFTFSPSTSDCIILVEILTESLSIDFHVLKHSQIRNEVLTMIYVDVLVYNNFMSPIFLTIFKRLPRSLILSKISNYHCIKKVLSYHLESLVWPRFQKSIIVLASR